MDMPLSAVHWEQARSCCIQRLWAVCRMELCCPCSCGHAAADVHTNTGHHIRHHCAAQADRWKEPTNTAHAVAAAISVLVCARPHQYGSPHPTCPARAV